MSHDPLAKISELPPLAAKHIDAVCLRFEAALQAAAGGGPWPHREDYLGDTPEPQRSLLLGELEALERTYRTPGPEPSKLTESFRPAGPASAMMQATCDLPAFIDKYRVVERLGGGGQGEVFRAVHPDLPGRDVVIKWARPDVPEDRRQQLLEEGRVLARLDEPGVVRVYDVGIHEDRPFVVLEHVAGRSPEQLLKQQLPPARAAALLVAQLAAILDRVHQHNVLHRDLKPGNIVIDAAGRPRLIDFGLAWRQELSGEPETPGSGVCGTFAYMAPEQANGQAERIGPRTDVFGLGAVLYELLTGRPPHEGASRTARWEQARRGQVTSPREVNPRIPRALDRICRKALAADPEQRYASAGEMERALRRYLWQRRLLAPASALILMIVVGLLLWRPWGAAPPQPEDPGSAPAPLLVKNLRVIHLEETPDAFLRRDVGTDVFGARFGDLVQVYAEFSEPVYAFVMAFNPDGREQLCLPKDPGQPPELRNRFDYPGAGHARRLNDGVGLQAFVVVASRQPLPAYEVWKGRRSAVRWQTLPAKEGAVWRGDGERLEPVTRSGDKRGDVVELRGVAPLAELCRSLRAAPAVEVLAAEAFPVLPKGGQ
jgi:serine/threonine protein kinase